MRSNKLKLMGKGKLRRKGHSQRLQDTKSNVQTNPSARIRRPELKR